MKSITDSTFDAVSFTLIELTKVLRTTSYLNKIPMLLGVLFYILQIY